MHSDSDRKLKRFFLPEAKIQSVNGGEQVQPRPDRTPSIIFMGVGIAEVNE